VVVSLGLGRPKRKGNNPDSLIVDQQNKSFRGLCRLKASKATKRHREGNEDLLSDDKESKYRTN
jgi:hypothetical protein